MIRLSDIRASLTKLLSASIWIHVVAEDIEQVGVLEGSLFPLLHIQLMPMTSSLEFGAQARSQDVFVDITYMEETKSSNKAMYAMYEEVGRVLGAGLYVKDRFLHIETLNSAIADDLLHITFTITYSVAFPESGDTIEKFEELNINV